MAELRIKILSSARTLDDSTPEKRNIRARLALASTASTGATWAKYFDNLESILRDHSPELLELYAHNCDIIRMEEQTLRERRTSLLPDFNHFRRRSDVRDRCPAV